VFTYVPRFIWPKNRLLGELPSSIAVFGCWCAQTIKTPANKTKTAIARGLCGLTDDAELLGCHLFGFAFLPHQLQLALGFLEGGRYFLLHAGSGFFEFLR
jgi:hypothetical protein